MNSMQLSRARVEIEVKIILFKDESDSMSDIIFTMINPDGSRSLPTGFVMEGGSVKNTVDDLARQTGMKIIDHYVSTVIPIDKDGVLETLSLYVCVEPGEDDVGNSIYPDVVDGVSAWTNDFDNLTKADIAGVAQTLGFYPDDDEEDEK